MMVRMRVEFYAALCVQQRQKLRSNSTAYLKHVVLGFGDLCEVLESVHLLLKVTRKYRLSILTKLDFSVKLTTL